MNSPHPAPHPHTYTHKQAGNIAVPVATLGLVGVAAAIVIARVSFPHRNLPPATQVAFCFPIVICLVVGFLFSSLTISVADGTVTWWFGPGVWRTSVAISEIANAEVVRNPWWYGYGVRRTPKGWMYNIAGRDAVEVTLTSGRQIRLGTDEPHTLAQTIMTARG